MAENLTLFGKQSRKKSNMRLFLLLSIFLSLGSLSWADDVLFSSKIQHIKSSAFPQIETKLAVFSRKPVPELSKDHFWVKEDGVKITDFDVQVDATPVFVSLVLDRSGSMSQALPKLKRAAYDFIKMMDGKAYVQLVSFSSDIKKHTSFSNVPSYFKKHINRLEAFGATALYDAIDEGVTNLHSYPTDSRKVVVAFTDGNDQNAKHTGRQSKLSVKTLVKKVRRTGVPLYLIGLGSEVNQKLMGKMAKFTGGTYLHARNREKLAAIFRKVAKMVELGYVISYKTPNPKYDGSWRKVRVSCLSVGEKDQGKGKYKAPEKQKEEPQKSIAKAKIKGSALGIPLAADPIKFIKEEFNARLIKVKKLDDNARSLDDSEPAKAQLKAYIDWANEELEKSCDKANMQLGPVLAQCVAAIAAEDFQALRPLAANGRQILKKLDEEVDAILAHHKKEVAPLRSEVQDRIIKSHFNIRFLYYDTVRLGIQGQSSSVRIRLFATNLHNNTYRLLVESFNHSVKTFKENQNKRGK